MRLHDLRHHHGTILAANGVSAKAIQARLGHASPAFTLARYIHHTPAMDEHASAVFGEAMNN
jgi:integrase